MTHHSLSDEEYSMSRDPWDRKANKLLKRNWETLCELWLDYPLIRGTPGTPPDCELAELISLQDELHEVGKGPKDIPGNISGLPASILKQGLFHLQKAAHVLNGAQIHIDKGMPSWSLSSAYHSAFCAVNGILNLLGIAFVNTNRGGFLIDVWSDALGRGNRKRTPPYNTRLQKTPGRLEQKNVWQVFQRILRINPFSDNIISEDWINAILALDRTDFSRIRNTIHYRTANWPYDDVRRFVTTKDFQFSTVDLRAGSLLDNPEDTVFPIALAFMLVRVAHQMLKSLVDMSTLLEPELDVFHNWLQGDYNLLYQESLSTAS